MCKKCSSLDTLAQLGTNSSEDITLGEFNSNCNNDLDTKRGLYRRARAKFFTNAIVFRLVDVPGSPLNKSYWNTYHCANTLRVQGDKTVAVVDVKNRLYGYCKNRWCIVCSRIRTAVLIKSYKPVLDYWGDECVFVTLTVPNVSQGALSSTLDLMQNQFRAIIDQFKKSCSRGKTERFEGLRKLECTYNSQRNDYHPHFHVIVRGSEAADALVKEWLRRFPDASPDAQDSRRADSGSVLELFKYSTKIVTKVNGKNSLFPVALDQIFRAMKGRRIFQPFGFKRPKVEEMTDEQVEEMIDELEEVMMYEWMPNFADWVSVGTGEFLTGYTPSQAMKELVDGFNSG